MLLKLYDSLIDFGERKIKLLYKLFSVFYGGYSHFFHKEAKYVITYFSSAEYWSMTIDYPDGDHEYYNDYWDGTLIIE